MGLFGRVLMSKWFPVLANLALFGSWVFVFWLLVIRTGLGDKRLPDVTVWEALAIVYLVLFLPLFERRGRR